MSPAAPAVTLLPSYASGSSDVPLLVEKIGDNFDRTVASDRCSS
jgi:fatty-acyl-CoA synthase